MHDFRKLRVWDLSRDLAVAVERASRAFPRSDHGVVSSQLRRAMISIPANIAEGCGKSSRKETLRYFQIAAGSAAEVENHLLIASEFGYLNVGAREELLGQLKSIQRMLFKLMKNLPE
ncbi:MAG: four helix bundle protein [bacterium]